MSAHHYTVHGLKSTLLSFANQLQLAPELRRWQGKHKDDVSGALAASGIYIISSVQKGWRPHTPLGRGGQIPIHERSFTLEKFKKDADDHQWAFFSFHQKQVFEADLFDPEDLENESDSSSYFQRIFIIYPGTEEHLGIEDPQSRAGLL